jgi:hypothetical protein
MDKWEADRKRLGLTGRNFDTYWRPIEEAVCKNPAYGQPLLDGSGARAFLTEEAGFVDLPKLVVYFKADSRAERLVFLGLDSASLPEDYPPPDLSA